MKNKALFSLVSSMVIFGTVGIFRKFIPLPSGFIAFSRGAIGALFLAAALFVLKKPVSVKRAGKNLVPLIISGALMGFNWIMLFEAYNYTSVAAATLCYYMAPVIVVASSPFLFKEKISGRKKLCICAAFFGMILVSGILKSGFSVGTELKGVLFGLGAALLYASVVIINKKTTEAEPFDKTVIQLSSAAAVLLPYTAAAEEISPADFTPAVILLLLAVGIIHTGIAYLLYFGSIGKLKAQTAAFFSYVDPVSAIILSAVVLGEKIGPSEIIGALLIFGSTAAAEFSEKKE